MKGKAVIVTGGAGYVGSHTCKALADAGYVPVVFDNLYRGNDWSVKWGPFERGDILDIERISEVIKKYNPVAVMHFAALAYVGESVQSPQKYYKNNVCGTLSLLTAMRDCGVNKLVFSSTAAVYGMPEEIPIPETHPKRPVNPYGITKLTVEHMIKDFSRAYGLRAVILRYFNAAGADPEGEIGEYHDPETHLIPNILFVASGKRPMLKVFGGDYDTPDGTCVRDFVHVSDLAVAHVKALDRLESEEGVKAFNLGTGRGYSVKEVIEAVNRVTGKSVPFEITDRREGDPPKLVADPSLIKSEMGWEAVYPQIESIIEHAWKWHVERNLK